MHAIGTLVHKNSYRSIGAGVRNKPRHRLHDERVADNQADHLRAAFHSGFRENRTVIEPHELHETDLAYALINHTLHFLERRCGGNPCREFDHVRPADRVFHSRQDGVKRLPGGYAPTLYVYLMSFHFGFTPLLLTAGGPLVSDLREASVDEQLGARDVTAVIRCQKHNGVGDFVWLAKPAEGYGARDHLSPLLTRFTGCKQLIQSRRVDGARADRVDANSSAFKVGRPRSSERADGRLRSAVNAVRGQAFAGHNRCIENDRGAFTHQRERFLYREQDPFDVDVENGIK